MSITGIKGIIKSQSDTGNAIRKTWIPKMQIEKREYRKRKSKTKCLENTNGVAGAVG